MEISKNLKNLATLFQENNYTLYIVGGFVRDSILELSPTDIDLSSNMPIDQIVSLCREHKYKTTLINRNLGTILISIKDEQYEYTQFRQESYSSGHTPDKIEFVDDIGIDCKRRDITINSIYYDITRDSFVDLVDGRKDIRHKIIRTPNLPAITLNDDGLRILRLIRFASTYNFKFSKSTYSALKKFKTNLKSISKERILNELKMLVVSDLKFNRPNNTFLKTFNNLGLLELTFNPMLKRIKKFSKSDIIKFYQLPQDARLMGLYVLVLKNFTLVHYPNNLLTHTINLLLGANGLKESNDHLALCEKLYRIFQNITYDRDTVNASINYLILSDTEKNIIDVLLDTQSKVRLTDNISFIKSRNLPLGIHQLDITAGDLLDAKIDNKFISKILSTLYNQVIEMKVKNEHDDLLKLAKDINNLFKNYIK